MFLFVKLRKNFILVIHTFGHFFLVKGLVKVKTKSNFFIRVPT